MDKKPTLLAKKQIETGSAFFLKVTLYIILGAFWLRFREPVLIGDFMLLNGLPIGLLIGFIFAAHENFQLDRKLEYAILIAMAVLAFFFPVGIFL